MKLSDLPVRIVRLAKASDPVYLDADESARLASLESSARYREKHPERVKAENASQYKRNRVSILAAKKSARYGAGYERLLRSHREANARYYAANRERINDDLRRKRKDARAKT